MSVSDSHDALPFQDYDLEPSQPLRIPKRFRRNLLHLGTLPSKTDSEERIQVPIEIIEIILTYLHNLPNSTSSLASCSIVCKAWHATSRSILFRSNTVAISEVTTGRVGASQGWWFPKYVLNPPPNFEPSLSAKRFIKSVNFIQGSFSSFIGGTLLTHADEFVSVQSLKITCWIQQKPNFSLITLSLRHSNLQQITKLEIVDGVFASRIELFQLIGALRELRQLTLRSCRVRSPHSEVALPKTLPLPPSYLQELHLWGCGYAMTVVDILQWVTSSDDCRLTTLSVDEMGNASISECLTRIGGALRRISINPTSLTVDLSKNSNLQYIELSRINPLFVQGSTLITLMSVTSNQVESLVIQLIIREITDLIYFNSTIFALILDRPEFGGLKRLTFAVSNFDYVPATRDYMTENLPKFVGLIEVIVWTELL